MNDQDYTKMLRLLAVVVSSALLAMSVKFSSEGFGFEMGGELIWVGTVLAIIISCIQIIWNHEGRKANPTIYIVGLMAYVYGIWANVSGIAGMRGGVDLLDDPLSFVFPVILGVFVEIVPEPLLVWAITGRWGQGDFITNVALVPGGGKQLMNQFRQTAKFSPPPHTKGQKRTEELQRYYQQINDLRKAGMPEPPEE